MLKNKFSHSAFIIFMTIFSATAISAQEKTCNKSNFEEYIFDDDGYAGTCYLFKADLRGVDLYGANLRGAKLRGADIQGADLYLADLRRADLRGAKLQGANLREADLRKAVYNKGTLFSENFDPRRKGMNFRDTQ